MATRRRDFEGREWREGEGGICTPPDGVRLETGPVCVSKRVGGGWRQAGERREWLKIEESILKVAQATRLAVIYFSRTAHGASW